MCKYITIICLALWTTPVWAIGLIGPPKASLQKRQLAISGEWTRSNNALDLTIPSMFYATHAYPTMQEWLCTLSTGITDNVTAKVIVGALDPHISALSDMELNGLIVGLGAGITMWEKNNLSFGMAGQVLVHEWDSKHLMQYEGLPIVLDCKREWMELLVGIGPTIELHPWSLYAGLCYYDLQGTIDVRYPAFFSWPMNNLRVEMESSNRVGDNIGYFFGTSLQINKHSSIKIESMDTGGTERIGVGIEFRK